ncbi:MAG TPA: glycosyltransferase family 4 protein [Actinomycetota bacterium]|jgi:glycosyltransferase involved in cell wall biosynthesis|nr:glycosyltransferase family 4 protein [Actinomycetota bacterium]
MSSSPLRVALVAPPWYEVPPEGYGGIEQVVGELANGLTARGHKVFLLATGQDRTDATLIRTFDEPQEIGAPDAETIQLVHAARVADVLDDLEVDIVHDHTMTGPLLARARAVPTVVTVHGPIDDALAAYYAEADVSLVAISESQRRTAPHLSWVATVYNAIDVATYPFLAEKDDAFLFLGRFSPDKGVEEAIEIARATGRRLSIAAKCEDQDEQAYYHDVIRPQLDARIRYLGSVEGDEKLELLRTSRALLFPIQWEEPFGMVMIEAMVCGTPVLATERGSVPEVVVDGVTGFVRRDVGDLIEAARRIDEIDPDACRAHVLERFNVPALCEGYESAYERVLEGAVRGRLPA